jgi:small subunit ribosomal protein S6
MNEYELMYIVPTSYTDEELGTIEKNVAEILSKFQATITKTIRLGKLRFAYEIKREQYGHYILVRFQAETASVAPIDEGLRMNQKEVLRHIIVKAEDVEEDVYNLVQFQEVHVEIVDRRRRPQQRTDKVEDKEKREKELKEGVAAIEEGAPVEKKPEEKEGIETLSAEELQKKIDEALDDKA